MPRKIDVYINEITAAIADIQRYIDGFDFNSYVSDGKTKDAVERKLLTAGEALNQMSKMNSNVRDQISDFGKIVAFRNILIHGYFGIDDKIVWDILNKKLPTLKSELETYKNTEAWQFW